MEEKENEEEEEEEEEEEDDGGGDGDDGLFVEFVHERSVGGRRGQQVVVGVARREADDGPVAAVEAADVPLVDRPQVAHRHAPLRLRPFAVARPKPNQTNKQANKHHHSVEIQSSRQESQ